MAALFQLSIGGNMCCLEPHKVITYMCQQNKPQLASDPHLHIKHHKGAQMHTCPFSSNTDCEPRGAAAADCVMKEVEDQRRAG